MFGRGRLGRGDDEGDPEPDLSPMIDCVFILLIFFIVTAVFVEEDGVPLPLPEDSSAVSSVQENNTVVFTLGQDNALAHDGKRIAMDTVGTIVHNAVSQDEETPVIIQAHPLAQHGVRTRVYDEVRQAGGEIVTFTQG
ncbi:ExbD/TolR family protein [Roseibacillus persicicus]|uniref:ExbD/TolR family protein n=1 Tax=Roseibacillus persicicus TaxID=454148 RepID=UPI00280C4D14|nr:biopolymer transporter ExbD [Roseibacillus persicicus]MDQ8192259.1 biopolymer transporter ExbD [Roseibacillus persicicus]